jgi:FMN phosphatase YigB (HAD superfamily)
MVGDSLSKDCAPARRLGLRAVWLKSASAQYAHRGEERADLVVRDLHELVENCIEAD